MSNNQIGLVDQRTVLQKEFKIYGTLENPLFLAKDVAEWIGNKNVTEMVSKIDDDEVTRLNLGGLQGICNFLTEDGLYEVLMQSRKPIAKQFKKEVKKILKQIRKTGGYIPVSQEDDEQALMAKAFLIAQRTIEQKDKLLKETKQELETKNRFINQIAVSENSILVREVAKIASKEGISIGERKLWEKLREWGMIFKKSTEPKQVGIERGYFEVSEGTRESSKGVFTYRTTRVTGKGQVYIIDRLLREGL